MRYGTLALAELALAYQDRMVSVRELARLQDLPVKYLEQILSSLKAAGIVRSIRGKGGGYALNRNPGDITLEEIFQILEGTPAPVKCVETPQNCNRAKTCPVRPTWVELGEAITAVLEDTTIEDIAERMRHSKSSRTFMYHI